jgi:hypothetical protein
MVDKSSATVLGDVQMLIGQNYLGQYAPERFPWP